MSHTQDQNTLSEEEHKLVLRNLKSTDYEDVVSLMRNIYQVGGVWRKEQLETLLKSFPEGQLCIADKGRVVAFALSLMIDSDDLEDTHTYAEITGNYRLNTHNANGNILYGIEIGVHQDYQGMRLGRRLYNARKELCEKLALKSIVAGGRMPNYHLYKDKLSPKEYIEGVKMKEIYDPVLTFQLSNGFHVKKVLKDYLPYDQESDAYATLIEWHNIYYTKKKTPFNTRRTNVRIGVVQWQMRHTPSLDSFMDNVEFFVDAVSGYKADFVLFPEYFNAPLMAAFNEMGSAQAIRHLAQHTEEIRLRMVDLALSYNINIIAGSMPVYEEGSLYNVSYLCRRDGTCEAQYKIHPTPSEVAEWGMQGGNQLQVFQTDAGKIGILICYDSEFPELSRLLADEGMEILFVPFSTDMQSGYQRVQICSKARAIENECYVAIAGSVGNLPKVINMDIQYAQSAIFSPSDFSFPQNAIIAEGTPNNEMTIVADVDLKLLKNLHLRGSVRNLQDRRKDLYEVRRLPKKPTNGQQPHIN
ncbi:bifunctional GNAT family N-acetyltransferase/carbon-nitrogen hydrolase family protein [Eisenibacter elegans]|jgi:predicted amidohydrolase/GNAT superfamily N-acetyltransferase|uniref:bifunctional GNAT family N-acetyltransferase/carbon-nitrogen hydrolase family protein n=1 Tax=Eisenibacter elegans TaxID=997 RepID=UPI0003FFDE9E|nr:bifunctional GNAT family N-acetyltransferase/carbon-nitrogen hydrolase family protein [Eisenibacter elegans]